MKPVEIFADARRALDASIPWRHFIGKVDIHLSEFVGDNGACYAIPTTELVRSMHDSAPEVGFIVCSKLFLDNVRQLTDVPDNELAAYLWHMTQRKHAKLEPGLIN